MSLTPDTLAEFREAAEEAARRGAAALEQWRGRFRVRSKGRNDLVTDADLAAQHAVKSYLAERFPSHGFLGEEDAAPGQPDPRPAADAPPTWVVDPLDGTMNYAHDVPAYCVSVGLVAAGEMVAGAIFDPRMNELFSAAAGGGATLNGKPLRVSEIETIDLALISTGFAADPAVNAAALDWWRVLSGRTQSLRRTGSTALNLAYVAAGRFDAYYAFTNHAWDVVAGAVLVREAGGTVTRLDGSVYDPFLPDIIATNGAVHAELGGIFRGASG